MKTGGLQGKSSPRSGLREGKIISWEDEKGFGWIGCDGQKVFAHIKQFERNQRRPGKGELVLFDAGVDDQGRSCARNIRFVRQGGRMGVFSWIILVGLLLLPLLALDDLSFPRWAAPSWFFVASIITYRLYASDKKRAQSGQWRIPENQLHLSELIGGWPGAWIAQRRLRHKVAKPSYQFFFWLIILLHQLIAADYLTGFKIGREIISRIQAWV